MTTLLPPAPESINYVWHVRQDVKQNDVSARRTDWSAQKCANAETENLEHEDLQPISENGLLEEEDIE